MSRFIDPVNDLLRLASSGYRREIINMSWLFFDRLFRVLGNFVIGIISARLLGPADYGGISYAQTVTAFLMLVVALGLNSVIVKRLVDQPGEAATTLGTALALQASATFFVMAIALGFTLTGGEHGYTTIIAIVACGLILRPTEVFRYWFEANVNARRAVISDNIAFLLSGTLKIAVLYHFRTVEALAWTLVAEQILGGMFLAIAYVTDRSRPHHWRVNPKVAKQILVQAWPLLLSGLAVTLYMRIDQFVIMNARGAAETGIYTSAVRLSEVFYVLPTIVATTFFPRWQALMGECGERHHRAVRSAMVAIISISAIIAACLSLAAAPIVHLLYGDQYGRAVPVMAIHAWTCVFVGMGVIGNQWYLSHGLQSRTLLCTILGAVSNFAINLLLVPSMGAVGGAIASLGAQIISTFLADMFSPKTHLLFFMKLYALTWPVALLHQKVGRAMSAKGNFDE